MSREQEAVLLGILARAQVLGFLGDAPLRAHVEHAEGFLGACEDLISAGGRLLDLGSGGGIPGLVVATRATGIKVVLVEGGARRSAFLAEAVLDLGLVPRVSVVPERAEVAGRSEDLRHGFDVVLARGFAAPAVTAECAAPFLGLHGTLVVSEPPATTSPRDRWPVNGCAMLGLEVERRISAPYSFIRLRAAALCDARFPRRVGVPAKRPIF